MKNRLISLYSYIGFLGIMYMVWHQTIKMKKHGGYDISEIDDLINKLDQNLQLNMYLIIDSKFNQQEILQFNSTIHKIFPQYNITFQQNSNYQYGIIIKIIQKEEYQFQFNSLKEIEISTNSLSDQIMMRNLKRFINNFSPNIDIQTFYTNRLIIFDLFIQTQQQQIIKQLENSISYLMNYFNINNYRINYKFIQLDNINNINENNLQTTLNKYKQIHNMNWLEYFQLNILLIYDEQIQNDQQTSFLYIEPNDFLFFTNSIQEINSCIYNSIIQLFQLEEQEETIFQDTNNQVSLFLLKQYFLQREYILTLKQFKKELEFIKFIQEEGDYKITQESQQAFKERLEYIINTLEKEKITLTNTIDITIDDRFSDLDTFSQEYTLGMYLPLILPFAYPIALSIYDELQNN